MLGYAQTNWLSIVYWYTSKVAMIRELRFGLVQWFIFTAIHVRE